MKKNSHESVVESKEEEGRHDALQPRKNKREVASKGRRRRRVSKPKHGSDGEEKSEEEEKQSREERPKTMKASMAGASAKKKTRKEKDELHSQMGSFPHAVPSHGFPYPYQLLTVTHQPQQLGFQGSKVSFSNSGNDYSANYYSNNTTYSNQENVGNDHSVTITKSKSTYLLLKISYLFQMLVKKTSKR